MCSDFKSSGQDRFYYKIKSRSVKHHKAGRMAFCDKCLRNTELNELFSGMTIQETWNIILNTDLYSTLRRKHWVKRTFRLNVMSYDFCII